MVLGLGFYIYFLCSKLYLLKIKFEFCLISHFCLIFNRLRIVCSLFYLYFRRFKTYCTVPAPPPECCLTDLEPRLQQVTVLRGEYLLTCLRRVFFL